MAAQGEKMSPEIDLDKILEEEIGQFGRFQVYTLMLVSLPVIFIAGAFSEYIFSTGKLPTRCLIPECDGANPEFEPAWLGNAVPGGPGSYDECNRFANLSAPADPVAPDTCPAQLFDRDLTLSCDEYVYERKNTVVYDFHLECDEWRRTLIGSVRTIGILFSMPLTGYISDHWGRRIALTFNSFNTAWIGMLRAFATGYEWYIFLHIMEAILGSGTYSACYLIATEFVGPKHRVIASSALAMVFAVGLIIVGCLAWAVQEWRQFTLALFVPQLIMIGYYWILPESARWLISKGRYTEAKVILKRAAKVNNTNLSHKTLEALRNASLYKESEKGKNSGKEVPLIVQVWRSPVIFFRCCITPFWWIAVILVYYGTSLHSVSLAGHRYLNFIYVSAVEIPGYLTAMFVLNKIGRKPTLTVGFTVCSLCQFGFVIISNEYQTAKLTLYLMSKYSISLVATSMYLYTAELYPTQYRQSLLGFSSMVGRIGSIVAPLLPALMIYWDGIPSVVFGSMTLLAGLLALATPETLGTKLPDTIEEAEIISRNKSSAEHTEYYQI